MHEHPVQGRQEENGGEHVKSILRGRPSPQQSCNGSGSCGVKGSGGVGGGQGRSGRTRGGRGNPPVWRGPSYDEWNGALDDDDDDQGGVCSSGDDEGLTLMTTGESRHGDCCRSCPSICACCCNCSSAGKLQRVGVLGGKGKGWRGWGPGTERYETGR